MNDLETAGRPASEQAVADASAALAAPPLDASAIKSLDRSLLHGIAWNAVLKLLAQVVSWSTTIVVARLLSAMDYGIYGIVSLLLGIVQMLTEFGIGIAVVTKRELTEEQLAQLNTISVMFGAVGALLMVLSAPLVALAFRRPQAGPVVAALSVTLFVASIRTVPWGVMQRDLRFKRLAIYDAAQTIALAAFSMLLAFLGFRYWTLVFAAIASTSVSTFVTVRLHAVPFARPKLAPLRHTLTFSREVVLNRLAWYGYSNADFAVASRVLGTTAAGYYGLAWTLAHLVVDRIAQFVFQVTPSVLARVQHDRMLLRRYYVLIISAMTTALWPATIGVSLVSGDFVRIFLGERWQPMRFALAVLSAYSSIWIILNLTGQLLLVIGEEAFARRNNIYQFVVMLAAFIVASRWGVNGIALAWLLVHPFVALPRVYRAIRRLELPVLRFLRDAMLPAAVACGGMAAVVLALRFSLLADVRPIVRLVMEIVAGAATYVGVQFVFFRERFESTLRHLRELRGGRIGAAEPAARSA